jgi:hypothetical protein
MCVCVCVRERERERERVMDEKATHRFGMSQLERGWPTTDTLGGNQPGGLDDGHLDPAPSPSNASTATTLNWRAIIFAKKSHEE